jgi:hypothetical protein
MLNAAWTDAVLPKLSGLTRAMFTAGRFSKVEGGKAVFAVQNSVTRDKCEERRPEVEAALATHFGRGIAIKMVADAQTRDASPSGSDAPSSTTTDANDEHVDLDQLVDAPANDLGGLDRLAAAFPGAEIVDDQR